MVFKPLNSMSLTIQRSLKGTLSKEKSAETIKRLSGAVSEIEASPSSNAGLLPYTWCISEEVEFENWGIGSNPVTPEIKNVFYRWQRI
jgi:phenylpyruvate tautomerase PptA (4-oxalocrotonate tautomerase family)